MKLFVPILRMVRNVLTVNYVKSKNIVIQVHGAKVKRFIEEVETV
jgi:hypothetical protein